MSSQITHFIFKRLPDSNAIEVFVDGVLAVLGTKYDIAKENLIKCSRTLLFANLRVADYMVYSVYDNLNDVESNDSFVKTEWTSDLTPTSSNSTKTITNTDTVSLINELNINEAVEYIDVTSISGVNNLKLNGQKVLTGTRIVTKDLFYLEYSPNAIGGGLGYFKFEYTVNNELTVYSFQVDIDVLASISQVNNSEDLYQEDFEETSGIATYDVANQLNQLKIIGGQSDKLAQLSIVVNSPYLAINSWSYILFSLSGQQFKVTANGTTSYDVKLDYNGEAIIDVENFVVKTDPSLSYQGNVIITLDSINNNTAFINSPPQTVTIITNY